MRLNTEIKYLLMLSLFVTALMLFFQKNDWGYLVLLFFFLTSPVYYYFSFTKLIEISKYLKNNHLDFYEKNLSTRRYKSLWLISIPIFGFLNDMKQLKDNEALSLANHLKRLSNYSFLSFIVSFILMLVLVAF